MLVQRVLSLWWLFMVAGGVVIGAAVATRAGVANSGTYAVGAALLGWGAISAYVAFRRELSLSQTRPGSRSDP